MSHEDTAVLGVGSRKRARLSELASTASSDGALLNVYNRTSGISSADIHDGQNLNLSVTCEDILPFIWRRACDIQFDTNWMPNYE